MLTQLRRQWRSSGQQGSVLSALLIIIAFLAILGGALLNEISGQFLLTQTLGNRIAQQATVNSSVESSIAQLQTRPVPARCSTDTAPVAAVSLSLNGVSTNVAPNCQAIVPDKVAQLAPTSFSADGTHVRAGGRDTYLVGDDAGILYDYQFGQTSYLWHVSLGRALTASPSQAADPGRAGHFMTLAPVGSGVALVDDSGSSTPPVRCYMASTGTVISQAGFENAPSSPYFPQDAFFGDSSGRLFVYDARTNGSCTQLASRSGLGGPVVGGPLVLTGQQVTNGNNNNNNQLCGSGRGGDGDQDQNQTSRTVDIFAIVNAGGGARLVHYQYCEATLDGQVVTRELTPIDSRSLSIGTPEGVAYSSTRPSGGATIRLAVTSQTGQVALATIQATNNNGNGRTGLTYTISSGGQRALGGSFTGAPYWWHNPGSGGDLIAAGNTNGVLYVVNTGLADRFRFDDGGFAINTTPTSDATGDNWYFGADDGYVHDVEPRAGGAIPMFEAAKFGPTSPVHSSPVAAAGNNCPGRVCLYFGAGNGSNFVQIGNIRVMDLCARLASDPAAACPGKSRLWARVEVGDPNYLGGQSVHVIAWSYFNS